MKRVLLVPDAHSKVLCVRAFWLSLSAAAITISSCAPTQSPPSGGHRVASHNATPICLGKRATVTGTAGDDRLAGTSQGDVIAAKGGNDSVLALSGDDRVCGGSGRDHLKGATGADQLSGGPANDYLSGREAPMCCRGAKQETEGPRMIPTAWGSTGALGETSFVGGREGTTSTESATTIASSDKPAMTC